MKRWCGLGTVVLLALTMSAMPVMAGKSRASAKAAAEATKRTQPSKEASASTPTSAEAPPSDQAEGQGQDEAAAAENQDFLATVPHVVGPKEVVLGHHARIALPAGMRLVEQAAAQEMLRKSGNDADDAIAAIFPAPGSGEWAVVIEAQDVGYVSDSDADELDASALLTTFKQGTQEQNKKRAEMGVLPLTIDGWSEPPRYDRSRHHLLWGLNAHDTDGKVVNFFTRFLGRHGYLSVNLIDAPESIAASKVQAQSLLNALSFEPGSTYADHSDDDHSSGMGLTALVLGGTGVVLAKKGGILIAILLAMKKGLVLVFVAVGAFFKRLFGRKSSGESPILPQTPSDPGVPPADVG